MRLYAERKFNRSDTTTRQFLKYWTRSINDECWFKSSCNKTLRLFSWHDNQSHSCLDHCISFIKFSKSRERHSSNSRDLYFSSCYLLPFQQTAKIQNCKWPTFIHKRTKQTWYGHFSFNGFIWVTILQKFFYYSFFININSHWNWNLFFLSIYFISSTFWL